MPKLLINVEKILQIEYQLVIVLPDKIKIIRGYLKKYNLRSTRSIFFTFYLDFLSLELAELPGPFIHLYESQFSFFTSN